MKEFFAGDWYGFWTGGAIRRAIYGCVKPVLRGLERGLESLG